MLFRILNFILTFPFIFSAIDGKEIDEHQRNSVFFTVGNNRTCHDICWNGNNCDKQVCKDCFFSCHLKTCRIRQNSCQIWCSERSDCSTYRQCRGCIFCREKGESCPLSTFKDKREIFNSSIDVSFWKTWLRSGKPYFHSGAPVFFDLNDDDKLDYFNSMHGHPEFLSEFNNRMEMGIGVIEGGSYTLHQYSGKIVCTDEDCNSQPVDAHGSAVMDLNGDGILDIYISNGGGFDSSTPNDVTTRFDNWLFWGEKIVDSSGELITIFKGGREEARKANLDMKLGRGRFNYFFDANNDGLLDIFSSQSRRVSNRIVPGVLLINQGDNTWKKDEEMMEYSMTMIVTDADGDGYAQEFYMNRSFCYPFRSGPGVHNDRPELGPYDIEVKDFCHTRPVGTPVVYSYNRTKQAMQQISKPYRNFWAGDAWTSACCPNGAHDTSNDCNAVSMVSGDFDNDQIADHIILYSSKMIFFFSSDRQRGELPDNSAYIGLEIRLPNYCAAGLSLQLVDIDNGGKEEILVKCKNVGVYLLYTRGINKLDWTLDNGCNGKGALGDISNRFHDLPTQRVTEDFCNTYSNVTWGTKDKICDKFNNDKRLDFTKAAGLSIVDVNNDGFRDIVSTNSFGHLRLYINKPTELSSGNKFIGFRLIGDVQGSGSNYYGIGATLVLVADDMISNEVVKQFREMSSSQHHTDFYGSKDDRITFGLGRRLQPKRIEIRWSNGFEQVVKLHDWSFTKILKPIDLLDIQKKIGWTHLTSKGLCLSVHGKKKNVTLIPCEDGNRDMKWKINNKGMILSKKFSSYCLHPKLNTQHGEIRKGVQLGISSPCKNSWSFTKDHLLRYGGSSFVLHSDDENNVLLWPENSEETKGSMWTLEP